MPGNGEVLPSGVTTQSNKEPTRTYLHLDNPLRAKGITDYWVDARKDGDQLSLYANGQFVAAIEGPDIVVYGETPELLTIHLYTILINLTP